MTKLLEEGELTPSNFLRQLAHNNDDLTENFLNFYESVATYDDSSDDEYDESASQASSECSQATTSSALTDMQVEVIADKMDEDMFDNGAVQLSFDGTNDNDNCIELIGSSAHSSIEQTNEDEPMPSTSQSVAPPVHSPVTLPAENFIVREFRIIPPSVRREMEAEKNLNNLQQVLDTFSDQGSENQPEGVCKICTIRPFRKLLIPCGHLSCDECLADWLERCRAVLREKYRSERMIEKQLVLTCMHCRAAVDSTHNAFYT